MSSQASGSNPYAAFDALHPTVQRWVWLQGWPALRPVQAKAIGPVLCRRGDVVIAAPTAGGKTEAAFLPIASDLAALEGQTLRCLAIAPLRALINDQVRRLESLCEATDLRIQPWHGDVTSGRATFWKRPTQFLMTTPESLEAMLMLRASKFGALCAGLRYIVIDELHAFIGTERGAQLRSLLSRVERLAGGPIPRVALSATLGEPERALRFLRPDGALPGQLITDAGHGGEIRVQVRAILERGADSDAERTPDPKSARDEVNALLGGLAAQARGDTQLIEPPPPPTEAELEAETRVQERREDGYAHALEEVTDHLFAKLRGDSHLIFANARRQVEVVADLLRERCETLGVPNEFFAHHGSLSRELRVDLEERLRAGSLPTTAVCTSTLELGIDIGDVASIAQVGPPPSVASLKQRLGRSGRRAGTPQVLRQYVILPALNAQSHLADWLRLPLVQAVATVELMLAGRFEPPNEDDLHLSTLVQQILSYITQRGGGATAAELYRELCERGAFGNVDRTLFAQVLRALGTSQVIEQVADGTLLPGHTGERLIADYRFYAAFETPEEFQLFDRGRKLGSIPVEDPLTPGQLVVFAGRRWKVLEIESSRRTITVEPARGGKPPHFGGGGLSVHRDVHQEMRAILSGHVVPAYLDATGQAELAGSREAFLLFGLKDAGAFATADGIYLAHFAGTRIGTTLTIAMQAAGLTVAAEGPLLGLPGYSLADAAAVLNRLIEDFPTDPLILAEYAPCLLEDKHDALLSPQVLTYGFAARHIDLSGARLSLREILARPPFATMSTKPTN